MFKPSPRFLSRSRFSSLTVLLGVLLVLGGCATNGGNGIVKPTPAHDQFVNQQMLSLATSVNQSLDNLQQLERGDQGPRKDTPVGMAVGGAAGPDKSPVVMPTSPNPGTQLYAQHQAAQLAEKLATNRQMLNTKINLVWQGGAKELLSTLSDKVDYLYVSTNATNPDDSKPDPEVKVDLKNVSVEDALSQVASQINKVADVDVNVANRTIQLLYK